MNIRRMEPDIGYKKLELIERCPTCNNKCRYSFRYCKEDKMMSKTAVCSKCGLRVHQVRYKLMK